MESGPVEKEPVRSRRITTKTRGTKGQYAHGMGEFAPGEERGRSVDNWDYLLNAEKGMGTAMATQ